MARDASPQKTILPKEISITDASAKYGQSVCLDQITLNVVPKRLTVLIGPVGCGKSNLLHLILGEVVPCEGRVWTNGVVSYASQDPWLFAGKFQMFQSTAPRLREKFEPVKHFFVVILCIR